VARRKKEAKSLDSDAVLVGRKPPWSTVLVAEAGVGTLAFGEHPTHNGDLVVDVVEDSDLVLGVVVAVQSAGVLGHRFLPGDRHSEHERVES